MPRKTTKTEENVTLDTTVTMQTESTSQSSLISISQATKIFYSDV